jgi:hypothetical protein
MSTNALGRIALAVLVGVVAGSLAAVLHYQAHAPLLVIIAAMLIPAIAISLILWKRTLVRLFASVAVTGVAYVMGLWIAVGIFHDGP